MLASSSVRTLGYTTEASGVKSDGANLASTKEASASITVGTTLKRRRQRIRHRSAGLKRFNRRRVIFSVSQLTILTFSIGRRSDVMFVVYLFVILQDLWPLRLTRVMSSLFKWKNRDSLLPTYCKVQGTYRFLAPHDLGKLFLVHWKKGDQGDRSALKFGNNTARKEFNRQCTKRHRNAHRNENKKYREQPSCAFY